MYCILKMSNEDNNNNNVLMLSHTILTTPKVF
jgi:hypothetical protein